MDRYRIEENMREANEAVKKLREIWPKWKPDKTLRGKLSAFGAAAMMSGLMPALAYFVENEPAVVLLLMKMDGQELPEKITGDDNAKKAVKNFFDQLLDSQEATRKDTAERFMEYGVSLKLVLNLYIKSAQNGETQSDETEAAQSDVKEGSQEGGEADGE